MTEPLSAVRPRLSPQAYRARVEGMIQKRLVSSEHARARSMKGNAKKMTRAGREKGELPDFKSGS